MVELVQLLGIVVAIVVFFILLKHFWGLVAQSFRIIWQKKYLWFIGFFAGLVAFGGEIDFFFRNIDGIDQLQTYMVAIRDTIQAGDADFFIGQVRLFISENPLPALSYFALTVLFFAIFAWLIIISQATLVRIIGRVAQKKSTGLLDGLAIGSGRFWAIFTMNVLAKMFTLAFWVVLALVPAIVFFISGQAYWAVITSLGWFVVSIPLNIIISFLMKYALSYIVLHGQSATQSLSNGWKLFRGNWLQSLEFSFVVFGVNVLISVIIAAVTLLLAQPFTPGGFVALLLAIALALGFVSAFSYAAWTLIFLKLQEGKTESRIGRWTTNLVNFAGPKKIAQ